MAKAKRKQAPATLGAEAAAASTAALKPQKFPKVTLEDAVTVPRALREFNGGNPWSPDDVAKALDQSPKSSDFYYLTAASRDFQLTKGTRDTEIIELTEFGRSLVFAENKKSEEILLRQAVFNVDVFKQVFEYYKGADLPEMKYVSNTLESKFNIPPKDHQAFVDVFRKNIQFVGATPSAGSVRALPAPGTADSSGRTDVVTIGEPDAASDLHCFVAMPFREKSGKYGEGFFNEALRSVIAPAGKKAGFVVSTANRDGSDVIQSTIVESLIAADLFIADLTEHNPNVLFELGMRMAFDKPVVLIRAKGTGPIFDVDNMLRVFEYDPNLWPSTVQTDVPNLTLFIKGTWSNRGKENTYMRILRREPARFEPALATATDK